MTVFAGQPILADDYNYIYNRTVDRPQCRLVQQSAQSLADNTETAITFGAGSEELDTHNMHDTGSNTSRITPPVAGWYRVTGKVYMAANADYNSLECYIRKNGTTPISSRQRVGPNTVSSARSVSTDIILVSMNGTTDYVELIAVQDDASGNANSTSSNGGSNSCTLELVYDRDL